MSDSEQEAWQQDEFDGMKAEIAQLRAKIEACDCDFIANLNDKLELENAQLRAKLAGECRDAAFYKCCALSGEIPSPGSEPSAVAKALTEGEK